MSMQRDEIDAAIRGQTVGSRFIETVETRADAPALRWREGSGFASWSWHEYAEQAARFAGALRDLDVPSRRGVLVSLRNRPERFAVETGVMLHRAITVAADDRLPYLAEHSRAGALVIDDPEECERFLHQAPQLRQRCRVVLLAEPGTPIPAGAIGYREAMEARAVSLREAAMAIEPHDDLNFLYTSGTTGLPKGAVATHAHVCWWAESIARVVPDYSFAGKRVLACLPMTSMAVRLSHYYLHALRGTEVTTCADPQQLAEHLPLVRPELFLGVPLIWERMYRRIRAAFAADPAREQQLEQALAVGRKVEALRSTGTPLPTELQAAWEHADAALLHPVRQNLGLDRCEIAISGTAPIPVAVVEFFLALGVPLSESYGLAEATAITFDPFRRRPGTVGRAIPGCELRLLDDGELLVRSGNLCDGYYDEPERTAETFDAEGWFHTGDIAAIDQDGYVSITGRKKELIIFSDGSNVPPVNVEGALKSTSPLISEVCAVGEGRLAIAALIVLDPELASAWARARGVEAADLRALASSPVVRQELERCVGRANEILAKHERIRHFVVLADVWAPGSKMKNPAAKLLRSAIQEHYAAEIQAMYREPL
jgi:long-chain acyl-CoA synthetase